MLDGGLQSRVSTLILQPEYKSEKELLVRKRLTSIPYPSGRLGSSNPNTFKNPGIA